MFTNLMLSCVVVDSFAFSGFPYYAKTHANNSTILDFTQNT
jgi:hypothetical protein